MIYKRFCLEEDLERTLPIHFMRYPIFEKADSNKNLTSFIDDNQDNFVNGLQRQDKKRFAL
ncbi:hypothetical protein C1645_816806 [Glomus cerebriforme]|uniref:Uncharacterized protein n=1 Tax=Glomus cerebriforme TaxID=658196 RepID=A0A397TDB2_9GLOM|nr:hypothetical protein C1645_816806 [Glomus cerebriforme]